MTPKTELEIEEAGSTGMTESPNAIFEISDSKTFKDLTLSQALGTIPKRFTVLLLKLISVKGVILVGAHLMVFFEKISPDKNWLFLLASYLLVIAGVEGLKILKELK